MSSCNKTPVAVLHELCVRQNIVEQYNLVAELGTPNDRVFKMSVETDTGLLACGSGKTKKEAKHNAAQAALKKLKVPAITSNVTMPDGEGAPPVVNPHADKGLTGNSVGRLQDYCTANDLPAPVYDLAGDEGEPHERTFSMKCEVSKRYEIGIGRTKQLAKHNAAQAMYETLMKNPSLGTRDRLQAAEGNRNSENLTEEQQRLLTRPLSNVPTASPGLKFSQYHEAMENTLLCVKEDLNAPTFESPVETLQALTEKLSLILSFHKAHDTCEDSQNGECYVYAAVNTQPVTVQIGAGESESAAKFDAAHRVLKYWQNFADVQPME